MTAMSRTLVALDLPGGGSFVEALRRVWDDGDAAFVVDRRLPDAAKRAMLTTMACGAIVDVTGERTAVAGGRPVDDGDALVVATSGSTGAPKGVVLTHAAVAASARATSARLDVGAGDRWLACLPLSHVGGLSVVTRALVTGTPLTVLPGFDADAVQRAATEGATLVSLVATALRRIDSAAYRVIVLGGSRAPADRPANAVTTYGLTETGSGVVYDGHPLEGVELRVDGGEVLVRGPMLLRAYRDGTNPLEDGWLRTGDVGHLEPDGRLVVEGRRGDLIISGGENVWPEPIEAVLRTVDGVADVAIVGRPDPEWGESVTALVVPEDPTAPPSLDQLRGAVKAVLPAYCAPRQIELVAALPRTALGKLRRAEL